MSFTGHSFKATLCHFYWAAAPSAATSGEYICKAKKMCSVPLAELMLILAPRTRRAVTVTRSKVVLEKLSRRISKIDRRFNWTCLAGFQFKLSLSCNDHLEENVLTHQSYRQWRGVQDAERELKRPHRPFFFRNQFHLNDSRAVSLE